MARDNSPTKTSSEGIESSPSPDVLIRRAQLNNVVSLLESDEFVIQWSRDFATHIGQVEPADRAIVIERFNSRYHLVEYLKNLMRRAK